MPNVLKITVENPDELRNAGAYDTGALIRVQSSATEAGAFADLVGTGSTPTITLVAATRLYTGYDPAGISSTWYRTRYENAGGSRVSDWSDAFQVGDETGGLICSVYDVEQRIGEITDNEREVVLDIIRAVTVAIEGATGRWFVPRPLSGTGVYRVHTRYGDRLRFPKGITSLSSVSIAVTDQPESGGSYDLLDAADWRLEPAEADRSVGWPATAVELRLGRYFSYAAFGAELTGRFGWSSVPADVQEIGVEATIRHYIGKQTAAPAVAVGPSGAVTLLRGLSPEARSRLSWYEDRS